MDAEQRGSTSPVNSNVPEKQSNRPEGEEHPHQHQWEVTLHDAQDWFRNRKAHARQRSERRSSLVIERTTTGKRWWKFTLRPWDDDEFQDWWFAGTAIPLLAATIGPLANVFSIAALVVYWRECLVQGADASTAQQCAWDGDINKLVPDQMGHPFVDPSWCIHLNIVSLVAGFIGNFFLLCNFTGRIRYIVALPVTILMWYIATGLLIGITVSMAVYVPPIRPQQTYSEGFWYAVFAAAMYMISSMMLMVNMLGYFLGHYPQHFTLTESQRTLILQTMLFFIWLAGGGAMFSAVESKYGNDPDQNWSYVNALYFSDVTILTVGFGDMYTTSDLGRGLLFPYSVGGIIMLGLMVSSISKFATEIGAENIIRKHVETSRARTYGRTVTSSLEMQRLDTLPEGHRPTISGPIDPVDRSATTAISFADAKNPRGNTLKRLVTIPQRQRKPKLIILREEKDRFEAMRHIQHNTSKFKRWYALCISTIAFGVLWCAGAVVFWRCEHEAQGMTYFEALYFCYVSLLTIGYGDFAPVTNPGRAFFVLWSLIAIPTMTILISDLGSTVINKFKQGTFKLADFTVLPKYGVWREFLEKHQQLLQYLQQRKHKKEAKRRLTLGFQVGPELEQSEPVPTIEELAKEEFSNAQLARKLTRRIRQAADEMKTDPKKRYTYEQWVEITQLIRFTTKQDPNGLPVDDEEGLIEWDWIGEESPMMARNGEPEFVLDRLIESMNRLIRNVQKDLLTGDDDPVGGDNRAGASTTAGNDADDSNTGTEVGDDSSLEGIDPLDARPKSKSSPPGTGG